MGSTIGGFFSFLKEVSDLAPQQQVNNALNVAWESWRYSDERPYTQRFLDNLTESQFKEAADVLGFDPRSITREKMAQTWAMANFIWDDAETQKLLLQFARDFISAQHKLEIMEGAGQVAGDIAIDILITALTVGAGATVAAGRKLKLLEKFKKLGPLFEKLAEAIKKRRKRKSKGGQTGGEVAEQLERPNPVDASNDNNSNHGNGSGQKSNTPPPHQAHTTPTGKKGGSPSGEKSQETGSQKRKHELENKSAALLAKNGYRVKQNPGTQSNGKNPDYEIEGKIFDCLSPDTSSAEQVRKGISKKISSGQTNRIVLNLDDSALEPHDIRDILLRKPKEGLEEVICIKNGSITHIYP